MIEKITIEQVFDEIRRRGKIRYKELEAALGVEPGTMTIRNKLVKLRERGWIKYIPAESAWILTDAGRKAAITADARSSMRSKSS